MPEWLHRAEIDYVHLEQLGGRRHQQDVEPDPNAGWQNASFKNYADYTLTPSYQQGIAGLVELATGRRVAVMCAEPMPWRCQPAVDRQHPDLPRLDRTPHHGYGETPDTRRPVSGARPGD